MTPYEQDLYIESLEESKKADLLADRVNFANLICSIFNMLKKKRQPTLHVHDLVPELMSMQKLPGGAELRTKIYTALGAEPPEG